MSFSLRNPSATWEPVRLVSERPEEVWAWFKPAHAPSSVVLQLPPELWRIPEIAPCLTVRRLIAVVGLESLAAWTVFGQYVPLDQNSLPLLDAPLPFPPAGAPPQLILWSQTVVAPAATPMPQSMGGAGDLLPGESPATYLDLIDFYWMSVLYLEADIERARMQLDAAMSKLNSLDRDLSFDELQAADNLDKKDWVDARRWLRSSAHSLSRSIKEIHTGTLSAAGQRNRFEGIYQQYVKARLPFPGIKQVANEFEMHYKTARNVLQLAQAVLSKGTAEAERRANSVLQRIAGKIGRNRINSRGRHS